MAIYRFREWTPKVGQGCYIAETAFVAGNVELGDGCWIGPGAVIRGDYGRIVIGPGTAVEDNVVIHCRPDAVANIGPLVTLGHGCIIHTPALIDEGAVIGMGAVVSDGARVGEWSAVGEAALVAKGQEVPPRSVAVGVPARVIKNVSEEWLLYWRAAKQRYIDLAGSFPSELVRVDTTRKNDAY